MRRIALTLTALLLSAGPSTAAELTYRDELGRLLVAEAPQILGDFDPATGHFGQGIWIVTEQNDMFALAAAYSLDIPGNPYHKDAKLLDVIVKAGDALIADADARGQWVFRKKDGSTWGKIWMPWTYSRWVRAFALIRDDMPADTQPDFSPKGEFYHVPSAATLLREPLPGLDLTYGPATCRLRVRIVDDRTLTCTFAAETDTTLPTAAHLTLLPHVGKPLVVGTSQTLTLGNEPIELSPTDLGGTLTHAGVKLDLPADASLHWPALPHNPYVRDGSPKSTEEGRIEIRLPLDEAPHQQKITLHVE